MAHLPCGGEIVLFDRSWYNRAGVERVMGFCTDEEYEEFFRTVPEFERMLVRSGIVLLKYWFSITDEEQDLRFRMRIHDPLKQWKLSGMDLESRRRWEQYTKAKEVMLERTHIDEARWWVVEAVDKKRARLNCIQHILSQLPYAPMPREPVTLPPREHHSDYSRGPLAKDFYVPTVYSSANPRRMEVTTRIRGRDVRRVFCASAHTAKPAVPLSRTSCPASGGPQMRRYSRARSVGHCRRCRVMRRRRRRRRDGGGVARRRRQLPGPPLRPLVQGLRGAHPAVRVDYQSLGSGAGITQFTNKTVDFGASDAAMTDEEIAKVDRGVQLIPMTAGSIVLSYNLPGLTAPLRLSRAAYAGIFLGKITKWNDPAIAAANPGVKLPTSNIAVVHRADSSGTTFVFTQHLSAISNDWTAGPGHEQVAELAGRHRREGQ